MITAIKKEPRKSSIREVLTKIVNLQNSGKFAESLPLCELLIKHGIGDADFLHLYGLALKGIGDNTSAELNIKKAIEKKPTDATLINSLGVLYIHTKKPEEAISQFRKAIKYAPNLFDPWNNLGNVLRSIEKYREAENALKRARKIDPERYEPYLNMALIMTDLRSYKNAEKFMDKALNLAKPLTAQLLIKRLALANRAENFEYTINNYGRLKDYKLNINEKIEADQIWARYLEINNKAEEALQLLEKWLNVESIHKDQLLTVVGMLYAKTGKIKQGIALHEKLLSINPEHITARWNLSLLQLLAGDVGEGFINYEARWKWREFPSMRRQFNIPRWDGQELLGKKLLVWREQGIGDEVRFSSLIPDLKTSGAQVTFECSLKMVNVFKRSFPWATVQAEGPLECNGLEEYSKYDFQIPIGSLARLFRKSVQDFYNFQKPWIPRITEAENKVRERLGVRTDQLLVGLCWRSSNQAPSRNRYYLLVEELVPLKNLHDVVFVTTQYDDCLPEVERVRELGLPLFHYVNVNQKDDLLSAIGLLGACDIVISANVSVADFCGGIGVPVIRIGPPQDAIRMGTTSDVPWYPTCKYIEVNQSEPNKVIAKIIDGWNEFKSWAASVTSAERVNKQ
jgi:tetratricopeptide (TPR) repeat protein